MPLCYIYKKVWSTSFIWVEVLEDLEANKQHPTLVWDTPVGRNSHTSDEGLLLLASWNFPDFYPRIKAKTLSSICNVPKDLTKVDKKTLHDTLFHNGYALFFNIFPQTDIVNGPVIVEVVAYSKRDRAIWGFCACQKVVVIYPIKTYHILVGYYAPVVCPHPFQSLNHLPCLSLVPLFLPVSP